MIVEFDEENPVANTRLLKALDDYVSEPSGLKSTVIEIMGEKAQSAFWRLRREAIIRAWSLKSAGAASGVPGGRRGSHQESRRLWSST